MKEYHDKKRFTVSDILNVMYADIANNDVNIERLTNGGKDLRKLLEIVDKDYFSKEPLQAVFDDLDTYQMVLKDGIYVSVDAIFNSEEKCTLSIIQLY